MLIGNWNILNAHAKQRSVKIGHCSVKNSSEWPRGHPSPFFIRNDIGFKSLTVTLWVYGDSREDIINNRSIVLSHLLEPVTLTLDGFAHKFFGIMTKSTPEETVMERWHKLTIEFNCYEFEDRAPVTYSGSTTILLNNKGNMPTPVTIEITPQIGAASIVLNGICRDYDTGEDLPVTVRELTTGNTVIIDGETGLITQDGELKAADVDIWSLPVLLPGENKITVNNNRMDITLRFRPHFM